MSPITTHVLDTTTGRPASGIAVTLYQLADDGQWDVLGTGRTDADGRITNLLAPGLLEPGVYQIMFTTGFYMASHGREGFYPVVPIIFEIKDPTAHYHVPLLLSPYGYSTYRGS